MTKTYSELRQEALFRAAREMWKIAASVLDDVVNDVELASDRTDNWAKSVSSKTAEMARALEEQGHEQCIASGRQEAALRRARSVHSDAITRYMVRRAAAKERAA